MIVMLRDAIRDCYLEMRYRLTVRRRVIPGGRSVDFGSLRQLKPISRDWGFERGQAVDRYYIEDFLARHSNDVRGRVLEVGCDTYTKKFGGMRVVKSDVLHVQKGTPGVTIIADLTRSGDIPSDLFDCIILTQTLQFIYDVRAAIRTLWRILKPTGSLLVTFPGISKISRYDMNRWGEYWRFTTLSARSLFREMFEEGRVEVDAYGNVLAAITFLHGIAAQELTKKELDFHDPDFEVIIGVRAVK